MAVASYHRLGVTGGHAVGRRRVREWPAPGPRPHGLVCWDTLGAKRRSWAVYLCRHLRSSSAIMPGLVNDHVSDTGQDCFR